MIAATILSPHDWISSSFCTSCNSLGLSSLGRVFPLNPLSIGSDFFLKMLKEHCFHLIRRNSILKSNSVWKSLDKAQMKNFDDLIFHTSAHNSFRSPPCPLPVTSLLGEPRRLHCPRSRHSSSQPASRTQATLT